MNKTKFAALLLTLEYQANAKSNIFMNLLQSGVEDSTSPPEPIDLTQLRESVVKAYTGDDEAIDDNQPAEVVYIPETDKSKQKKMLELDVNVIPVGIVNQ